MHCDDVMTGILGEKGEAAKHLDLFFWAEVICFVYLGGGNSKIFYLNPHLGKMSNLTKIVQMGGSTTNQ